MLKFIAKRFAKARYVFNQYVEAASNDLNASLAFRTADEHRAKASVLKVEADKMAARITEVSELEEKGYWLCENGHEWNSMPNVRPVVDRPANLCVVNVNGEECGGEVRIIRRDQMSGQEKYESDKERNEAQKIADEKRAHAKEQEDAAAESERTAKYFHNLAQANRNVAEKVKSI